MNQSLTERPAGAADSTEGAGNAKNWPAYALLLLLLIPFGVHLNYYDEFGPIVVADSFRYIWDSPVNRYFFYASSLTVRSFNYLLGNDPERIGLFQLVLAMTPAALLYLALRTNSLVRNLLLISVISILYLSMGPVRYFNVVLSESVFTSLLLSFAILLFAFDPRKYWWAMALFGLSFVFTRNSAPYVSLALLAIFALFEFRRLSDKRVLLTLLLLTVVSLSALYTIRCCDTTKEINVVDNLYSRVFPDPEKVELFRRNYGMPVGPFLATCVLGGSNVNDPCIDQQSIYTGDSITRQYRLTNDDYGFADWVRYHGMRAWQHYVLFANTGETWQQFQWVYQEMSTYMFTLAEHQNRFPVFSHLGKVFRSVGIFKLSMLIISIGIGMWVYFRVRRHPALKLGLALMLVSLPVLFVGYFGDSEETARYTYPAVLCLYLGLLSYLSGLTVTVAQSAWIRARFAH